MTREEAIAMLRRIQEPEAWEPQINESAFKAIDMAISALTSAEPDLQLTCNQLATDCIDRQSAIDALEKAIRENPYYDSNAPINGLGIYDVRVIINDLPSAQLERDIPIKPTETTDRAWGIPKRQAVCPKCDYYLGHIAFLGDYKGKRITYCETCGQAIDWEGWNFDE